MQSKKKQKLISKSFPATTLMPEYVLRSNIRILSNFVKQWGDDSSVKTVDEFVEEWNEELKRRGLKEEKYDN